MSLSTLLPGDKYCLNSGLFRIEMTQSTPLGNIAAGFAGKQCLNTNQGKLDHELMIMSFKFAFIPSSELL